MKRHELGIEGWKGGIQNLLKRKERGCDVRAGVELTHGTIAQFLCFVKSKVIGVGMLSGCACGFKTGMAGFRRGAAEGTERFKSSRFKSSMKGKSLRTRATGARMRRTEVLGSY